MRQLDAFEEQIKVMKQEKEQILKENKLKEETLAQTFERDSLDFMKQIEKIKSDFQTKETKLQQEKQTAYDQLTATSSILTNKNNELSKFHKDLRLLTLNHQAAKASLQEEKESTIDALLKG